MWPKDQSHQTATNCCCFYKFDKITTNCDGSYNPQPSWYTNRCLIALQLHNSKMRFFNIIFLTVIFSIQYAGVKLCFLQVLNQLCDVIVEPLRDRVVTGLLQASLVFNMLTKHSRVGLVMIFFSSSVGWFVASNTWWRAFSCFLLKWCQVNWRWSWNPKGMISHHYAEIAFQNLYTWSCNRKLRFHTTHCHSLLKVHNTFLFKKEL